VAKSSKSGVWDEVQEGSTLVFAISKFPYNTVRDSWKEASTSKPSSTRPVFTTQHRLVTNRQTDRRTDGHTARVNTLPASRRAVKLYNKSTTSLSRLDGVRALRSTDV